MVPLRFTHDTPADARRVLCTRQSRAIWKPALLNGSRLLPSRLPMRRLAKFAGAMCTIALVTACEAPVDLTTDQERSAVLLIDGVANVHISAAANMMAEDLNNFYLAAQISQKVASDMVAKLLEISSSFER